MFNKRLQHDFEIPNAGLHRVYLLEESDSVVTWPVICGQGEPVRLTFGNRNDSIYEPMKPGTLVWRIVIQNQAARDAIDAVFESIEGDYRVEFYQVEGGITENLIWRGDLLLDQYNEDLRGFPGFVELVANDLASLQGKNYLHTDGFVHTGRESQLQIIKNCVQLLGYELGFACSDGIFEDTMDTDPMTDDPMLQAYADNAWFYPVDQFGQTRLMSAWDVMSSILISKACRIRQWGGRWFVEQIVEGVADPFPNPLGVVILGRSVQTNRVFIFDQDLVQKLFIETGGSGSTDNRPVALNQHLEIIGIQRLSSRYKLTYDFDANTGEAVWLNNSTAGENSSTKRICFDENGNSIFGAIFGRSNLAEGVCKKVDTATGDMIWKWSPTEFVTNPYACIPAIGSGLIWVTGSACTPASPTSNRSFIGRIDPETGNTIWVKTDFSDLGTSDTNRPEDAFCDVNGNLSVLWDTFIKVYDLNGDKLYEVDFGVKVYGVFVDKDFNHFVVSAQKLFRLDSTLTEVWNLELKTQSTLFPEATWDARAVTADSFSRIYIGSLNFGLQSYDYDGTLIAENSTVNTTNVINIDAHPSNPAIIIPPEIPVIPPGTFCVDYSISGYGYIRIPHLAAYSLSNYTVELWVKTPSSSPSDNVGLVNKRPDAGFDRPLASLILSTGSAYFAIGNGAASVAAITTPSSICDGGWHHLAFVKENTGGNDTIRLMLDGDEVASATPAFVANTNTNDVLVGKASEADGPSSTINNINRNFKNQLVELRIWNVARTEAQIAANRSILLNGDEAGLIGYWPLQYGPKYKDITATANTGTATGVLRKAEDFPFTP